MLGTGFTFRVTGAARPGGTAPAGTPMVLDTDGFSPRDSW